MKNKKIFYLVVFVFFGGCATISQSDFASLKSDVAQLQVKVESLANKQTDLYSKYEMTMVANDTKTAAIDELHDKISQLSQKIQDLQTVTSNKNMGSDIVSPSTLYKNAYNDFLMRKYDIALSGFRSFIKKYPEQDLAPQAQYYIAESLYLKDDFTNAYGEYEKVEKNYPSCEFVVASKLKMAICLEQLNKQNDAMLILESIVLNHPNTPEAFTAKEKIKEYTNAKSK